MLDFWGCRASSDTASSFWLSYRRANGLAPSTKRPARQKSQGRRIKRRLFVHRDSSALRSAGECAPEPAREPEPTRLD